MSHEDLEDWRAWTKEKLEEQYSPSSWSKRYDQEMVIRKHVEFSSMISENTRDTIPGRLDISYAHPAKGKLDIFSEELPDESPILVYVHGGYWQELNKNVSLYPVQTLKKNGIIPVIVGYTLAPEGSIENMIKEIQQSLRWVSNLAETRGSSGVYLMGWSAGAQLIIESLKKSHVREEPWVSHIKGFVTISGIFDLRPLVGTYVNEPLHLTEKSAWNLSPFNQIDNLPMVPSLIVYGENDPPEFQRQSREYCQALREKKYECQVIRVPNVDHFNIVEKLSDVDYALSQKISSFIKRSM